MSTFNSQQPIDHDSYISRAEEVAKFLAKDIKARDVSNQPPYEQIQLLKDASLVNLLGPKEYGGGGMEWRTAYYVVRVISRVDASIGQLIAYHYTWSSVLYIAGTEEQYPRLAKEFVSNQYFCGAAANQRDNDMMIKEDGETLIFNGKKFFSTGCYISDITFIEGVIEGTDKHVFAYIKSKQKGVEYMDNWDNLGQRQTCSGGCVITDVKVPWADALGYNAQKEFSDFVPFHTIGLVMMEMNFSNMYLGIAQGAFEAATTYTRDNTRAWPYGGDNKERASDEWYIVEGYGVLQTKIWAGEALVDRTVEKMSATMHMNDKTTLTFEERGKLAVEVAACKVFMVDTALEVTNKIFELMGARSSSNKVWMDVYWRNIRTHSLHDPLPYKKVEVGRYALNGTLPEPTWYT